MFNRPGFQRWLFALTAALLVAITQAAKAKNIVVMGDSISAAYGIALDAGWVHLLSEKIAAEYKAYRVINASVSGETTGGGLTRLPAVLAMHRPEVVILELGGNDGLRGYPVATIKDNLKKMLALCEVAGARTLLVPMRIPPNYGPAYTTAFFDVFTAISRQTVVPLSIFFLEGVAGNPALMQADGIHPNAKAQPVLLANIWPALRQLLY